MIAKNIICHSFKLLLIIQLFLCVHYVYYEFVFRVHYFKYIGVEILGTDAKNIYFKTLTDVGKTVCP